MERLDGLNRPLPFRLQARARKQRQRHRPPRAALTFLETHCRTGVSPLGTIRFRHTGPGSCMQWRFPPMAKPSLLRVMTKT